MIRTVTLPTSTACCRIPGGGGSDTLVVWEENGVKKTDIVKLYQGEDCNDGRFLVAGTESYFANNYSLYNMSGNAAEMISEDNRCMGGSWLDPAEDMRIGRSRGRGSCPRLRSVFG